MACMIRCPERKNYKLTSNGPMLSCSYTGDPKITVQLNTVPAYLGFPASYLTLPNKEVYEEELKRFNNAIAVADANIDKNTKISTAFIALQAAENARSTAPDAYQQARITYYTLAKGDSWLQEEQARIAATEAQPVVDKYVSQYNNIQDRKNQQQSTIDVVNGVRDKILTVKDDLRFSVNTFQKQIGDIKNQINKNKVEQTATIAAATSWVDTFLNWAIALVTLVAIVLLARRLMGGTVPRTVEEMETQARLMRAQAMLRNANTRGPTSWFS